MQTSQYVAVVTETKEGATVKRVVENPGSMKELRVKAKAQRLQLKATNEEVKAAKQTEAQETGRGFKRPQWVEANRMEAVLGDKSVEIDVMLEDSWDVTKEAACEKLGISPEEYRMQIVFGEPADRVIKKKPRPAKVGELNVWDCTLNMVKREKTPPSSSSSSSSSEDSKN